MEGAIPRGKAVGQPSDVQEGSGHVSADLTVTDPKKL
jgi:hypothetical protein